MQRRILSFALVCAGALLVSPAYAESFVLPAPSDGPVHQCHNPHVGTAGGYQIDFDGLGLESGNPHAAYHFSGQTNANLAMTSVSWDLGTLVKPAHGNTPQTTDTIKFSASLDGATFYWGSTTFDNVLSVTLQNAEPIDLHGTQVEMGQLFTLTILTTTGTTTLNLETIMGSSISWDKSGRVTDVNLRFCGGLATLPPPPPPPPPPGVPEPTTLFTLGLVALSSIRAARRKLVA